MSIAFNFLLKLEPPLRGPFLFIPMAKAAFVQVLTHIHNMYIVCVWKRELLTH